MIKKEEELLKEKRKELSSNFVITGLKEPENETTEGLQETVEELLEAVDCKVGIQSLMRIGKVVGDGLTNHRLNASGRRPRLVKVITKGQDERNKVLKKVKALAKIDRYKNIFINPDRCRLDRMENSRLRKVVKDLRSKYPHKRVVFYKGEVLVDGEVADYEKPLCHVFPEI